MAAKIEVAMKKSEPMSWARLDLPPPVPPPKESEEKKEEGDSDEEDEWWAFKLKMCIFSWIEGHKPHSPFFTSLKDCLFCCYGTLAFYSSSPFPPFFSVFGFCLLVILLIRLKWIINYLQIYFLHQ